MTTGTNPLVNAAELHDLLGTVTVLDVRYRMGGPGGPDEYARGHVPGASYVDQVGLDGYNWAGWLPMTSWTSFADVVRGGWPSWPR